MIYEDVIKVLLQLPKYMCINLETNKTTSKYSVTILTEMMVLM